MPDEIGPLPASLVDDAVQRLRAELTLRGAERIDSFERFIFDLLSTSRSQELRSLAARIVEEGARPSDLLARPGRRPATVVVAVLIRAFRPPFKFSDNALLGKAQYWEYEA